MSSQSGDAPSLQEHTEGCARYDLTLSPLRRHLLISDQVSMSSDTTHDVDSGGLMIESTDFLPPIVGGGKGKYGNAHYVPEDINS
jgi:hypothetical protein